MNTSYIRLALSSTLLATALALTACSQGSTTTTSTEAAPPPPPAMTTTTTDQIRRQ